MIAKAPPRGWARGGAATDDGFEGGGPVAVENSGAGALPAFGVCFQELAAYVYMATTTLTCDYVPDS